MGRIVGLVVLLAVVGLVTVVAVGRLRGQRPEAVARQVPSDAWVPMATPPLVSRMAHSLVWTGREAIVWGGVSVDGDAVADGASYDPATDGWRTIAASPLSARGYHVAVWTGREMIVWGGVRGPTGPDPVLSDGAAYDPVADTWRPLPPSPLALRVRPAAVWTGAEMVVLGGLPDSGSDPRIRSPRPPGFVEPANLDGAAYDPVADTWRVVAAAPLPASLSPGVVWDGARVVVVTPTGTAAAYDPPSDQWQALPAGPSRESNPIRLVWTGEQLFAVDPTTRGRGEGSAYAASDEAWAPLPQSPFSTANARSAVWTGREIVLGGVDGLAYNVASGAWRTLPPLDSLASDDRAAVWTGEVVVLWGGYLPGAVYWPPR